MFPPICCLHVCDGDRLYGHLIKHETRCPTLCNEQGENIQEDIQLGNQLLAEDKELNIDTASESTLSERSTGVETMNGKIKEINPEPDMQKALNTTINATTSPDAPLDENDETWYWVLRGLVGVIIVFGNALIIYLIATRRSLHSTTNWLTLSLATADFLIGIAVVPSSYFCAFKLVTSCDVVLVSILNFIFLFVSVGNLCVITVDRYVAVRMPYKYYVLKTRRARRWMIGMAWGLPGVVSCLPLTWQHLAPDFLIKVERVFYTIQITAFTIMPCAAMLLAYALIYYTTWRQSHSIRAQSQLDLSQMREEQRRKRLRRDGRASIRVYGLIVLLFVVCWSLSAYRYFRFLFGYGLPPLFVIDISRLLILLNSAVNPLVYSFFKRDIRAELVLGIMDLLGRGVSSHGRVSVSIPEPSSPLEKETVA
ncbi:trace amine-associated receptor 8a [Nematostella vectensis]|nr:trace amine-associated receptor 8a [Nematostella vectensis]